MKRTWYAALLMFAACGSDKPPAHVERDSARPTPAQESKQDARELRDEIRLLDSTDRGTRADAIWRLGLRSDAGPACARLAIILTESDCLGWLAVDALASIGPVAIPHIVPILRESDGGVVLRARVALVRLLEPSSVGLILDALRQEENPEARVQLLAVLSNLGPLAIRALPSLKDLAKNGTTRLAAAAAVARVSPRDGSVMLLLPHIAAPDEVALSALLRCPRSQKAIARLRALSRADSGWLRFLRARQIAGDSLGTADLERILLHISKGQRDDQALDLLAFMGRGARPLIPSLLRLVPKATGRFSVALISTICEIRVSADASATLGDWLDNRDANLRAAAAQILGYTDFALGPRFLDALQERLPLDKSQWVREANVETAVLVLPRHPELRKVLETALDDESDHVVGLAAYGFQQSQELARSALPQLRRLLKTKSRARPAVVGALERSRAKACSEDLLGLLEDEDPVLRLAAVGALGVIGEKSAEDPLRKLFASSTAQSRIAFECAIALWRITADATPLRTCADRASRRPATLALTLDASSLLGAEGSFMLPLCKLALQHRNPDLRIRAARGFWKITGRHAPVLPALKFVLATEAPYDHDAFLAALELAADIGAACAQEVVPIIRDRLLDLDNSPGLLAHLHATLLRLAPK